MEKKIINHSKILVTVGEGYADLIASEFEIEPSNFEIIYNGYFQPTSEKKIEKNSQKFTISFFGNFYLIQKEIVAEFLKGLGKMIKEKNLEEKDIVFQYAGNTSRKVLGRMIAQAEIQQYFKDLGYLTRERLNKEILRSNVVFDIVPKGTEYMIHTKIYDYCKGDSNIVVVGERGSIVELLEKLEQAYTSVAADSNDIAKVMKKLYKQWQEGKILYGCNKEKLKFYERQNQAKLYATVIKNLLK
jgi:hypothetical protein